MSRKREARQKLSAKERRAENRRLAQIERRRRQRLARTKQIALVGAAVIAVLAVVTGSVVAVKAHIRAGRIGPINMASDGLLLTGDGSTTTAVTTKPIEADGTPTPSDTTARSSGTLDFVLYVDYGDPATAAFWQTDGELITSAVTSGYATLEIHPVALATPRDDYTQTPAPVDPATDETTATPTSSATPNPLVTDQDYSQRAANTFACVASFDPNNALAVNEALMSAQSDFGAEGLTDDKLVALVQGQGIDSAKIDSCITSQSYVDWVEEATDRAALSTPFDSVGSLVATPTVVIAGQEYTGSWTDQDEFLTFVTSVYESLTATADPTGGTTGS